MKTSLLIDLLLSREPIIGARPVIGRWRCWPVPGWWDWSGPASASASSGFSDRGRDERSPWSDFQNLLPVVDEGHQVFVRYP